VLLFFCIFTASFEQNTDKRDSKKVVKNMKNDSGENGGSRFVAGKGFYVALAVCLLGAAAAAWISVDRSLESAKDQENVPIEETAESYGFEETNENADLNEPDEPTEVPVDTPQEDIPVEAGDNTVEVGEPVEEAAAAEEEIVQDPSAEAGIFSGKTTWSLPVEGDIINDFSNGELVKNETLNEWRTHNGIDIAAEVGSDIHVCADGTVTRIWSDPLWGECVQVEHADSVISVYCGLTVDSIEVEEGDTVARGDVLGTLGETNLAEIGADSHLHFVMKQGDAYADPLQLMGME